MLNFIKKQGLGTWISLGTIVLSLVGLIIYAVALGVGKDLQIASGSELFYIVDRPEDATMITAVTTCGVLTLVILVATVVLAQFKFEGLVGKVCDVAIDVLRVAVPVLLLLAAIYLLYGSFTGIGWTFFSNEELAIADTAKTVGGLAIAGSVILALAGVVGIVSPFFNLVKKEAE